MQTTKCKSKHLIFSFPGTVFRELINLWPEMPSLVSPIFNTIPNRSEIELFLSNNFIAYMFGLIYCSISTSYLPYPNFEVRFTIRSALFFLVVAFSQGDAIFDFFLHAWSVEDQLLRVDPVLWHIDFLRFCPQFYSSAIFSRFALELIYLQLCK